MCHYTHHGRWNIKMSNKIKLQKPVFYLYLCLFGLVLSSGYAAEASSYPSTKLSAQVDKLFAPWDKPESPGAAVGVFKDGKIIYAKGYGIANLDYDIPMSPQTALRTGSLSKQFIAMAIALLAEQGKLSVDDDIREYLPEIPDYGKPITLSHLLHHTSGIREYITLVSLIGKPEGSGYVYTPDDLLSMLARQKALDFTPGEKYSYSNSGYFLLAEIISRVSGTSASHFLKKNIFEPLGMTNTILYDNPNDIVKNRGVGYSPLEGGGYRLNILRLKVIGDLGVVTTVEDFFKWDQNFYTNKLGKASPTLIETLLSTGTLNNGEKQGYAYGLELGSYRGLNTVHHSGSAVGFVTNYLQFPQQKLSIIVLSNVSSFEPEEISEKIADLYLEDQLIEMPLFMVDESSSEQMNPTRDLNYSEVKAYAADYYSDELNIVYRLRNLDGELNLKVNALSGSIQARAKDLLTWGGGVGSEGGADLKIIRDSVGKISGFSLQSDSVQGLIFTKLAVDAEHLQ